MEAIMAWMKDAVAGVGLVVFFTSSFLLMSAAQSLLAVG
jgi:hypothetical protein